MTDFGVTLDGFVLKTVSDILDEMVAAEKSAFGPGINTQSDSALGVLNGLMADQAGQLWQVAQAVYRALYPDSASGDALDNVGAFTGATRIAAAPSTATVYLNITDGVTVPEGSEVSVGSTGTRWKTTADVTASTVFGATQNTQASVENVDTGAIAADAGAIDNIATPISGWSAKAGVASFADADYILANGMTLLIAIDGGAPQTITFHTGDFVSIAAATAAEVVAKISAGLTGGQASVIFGSSFRIESNTEGSGSSIQITGGTSVYALGLIREEVVGFNYDRSAKLPTTLANPYVLADLETLTVTVDGTSRSMTFHTADFVDITNATSQEVAKAITAGLGSYLQGIVYNDDYVQVESLTAGANSSIEFTGGTALAALGFSTALFTGSDGAATAGTDLELDAAYRLRREALLRISGKATVEAIRAAVRALDGVVQALVFENTTDEVDGDGLDPHSFEVVVEGGDDTDIAQTIFDTKDAGIDTYRDPGSAGRTVTITDSQGFTHDINFTRPTTEDMYVAITVSVDADVFGGGITADGEVQVQEALAATGSDQQIGDDVIINRFLASAMEVAGVLDVTVLKIDTVNPPVNTANISVAARTLALFDTSRIVVSVA